jgi:hypothetical protein
VGTWFFLDVSNNPKLKVLDCSWNELHTLIIFNNDSLKEINCSYFNKLTFLNVTGAPNLEILGCSFNGMYNLVVNNMEKLHSLGCSNNNLTTLDVSGNTALFSMACGDNLLTNIKFENNDSLKFVYCDHNNLSELDLDGAPNLRHIECYYNSFQSLTVAHQNLEDLFCSWNSSLSFLDISESTNITNLQMNGMPQYIKVCVWTLPFPPTDPYVITGEIGSPDIHYELCPMGIEDQSQIKEVEVFPNPFSDYVNFSIQEFSDDNFEITIIDNLGRKMMSLNETISGR